MKKEEEKRIRKERKIMLEKKWEMVRWLSNYIEENTEIWEAEGIIRREKEKSDLQQWEKMKRFEKIEILKKRFESGEIEKKKLEAKYQKDPWETWREKTEKNENQDNTTPLKIPNIPLIFTELQDSPGCATTTRLGGRGGLVKSEKMI